MNNMLIYLFLTAAEQLDAPDAKWSLFLSVRPLDGAGEHLPHGTHRLAEGADPDSVARGGFRRLHVLAANVTGGQEQLDSMSYHMGKPDPDALVFVDDSTDPPTITANSQQSVYLVSEAIGKGIWDEVQAAHRRERKAAAAIQFIDSPTIRPLGDPATASDNTITHEPSLLELKAAAQAAEPKTTKVSLDDLLNSDPDAPELSTPVAEDGLPLSEPAKGHGPSRRRRGVDSHHTKE